MLEGRKYISFDLRNSRPGMASLLDYLARLKGQKELGQAVLVVVGLLVGAAWLGSK